MIGSVIVKNTVKLIEQNAELEQSNIEREELLNEKEQRIEGLKEEVEGLKDETKQLEKEVEEEKKRADKRVETRVASSRVVKTQPVASVSLTGVDRWRSLCEKHFPGIADQCLAIMSKESGGNPTAYSPTNDAGLMQINVPTWGPFFGLTAEQLFDPETNMKCARVVYDRAGGSWRPWTVAASLGL